MTAYMKVWMPRVIGVGVPLTCIATVILVLRVYTYLFVVRHKGGGGLLWATIAWILGVLNMVIYYLYNQLVYSIPQWIFRCLIFAPNQLSITFTKLGMVCYILEIQGHLYRFGKWVLLLAIALCFICVIITLPLIYFDQVWSDSHTQNPNSPFPSNVMFQWSLWTGGWYAFTDFVLVVYPVFLTWNLRIATRLKVIICILMGLGAIGTAVNIANLVTSVTLSNSESYGLGFVLNVVEMWLVFIAASAAPLWPLLTSSGRQCYNRLRASLAWIKLGGNKKSGDRDLREEAEMRDR